MTRNRPAPAEPRPGRGSVGNAAAILATLVLLAPATALLLARARALTDLESAGGAVGCSGAETLGTVLHAGLPVVALVVIVPVALLSLAGRARGWIWLALALVGTVLLDLLLRATVPGCL